MLNVHQYSKRTIIFLSIDVPNEQTVSTVLRMAFIYINLPNTTILSQRDFPCEIRFRSNFETFLFRLH